jgi:hypothetical protein
MFAGLIGSYLRESDISEFAAGLVAAVRTRRLFPSWLALLQEGRRLQHRGESAHCRRLSIQHSVSTRSLRELRNRQHIACALMDSIALKILVGVKDSLV